MHWTKELKKEVEEYKKFIINPLNIEISKTLIQKENTFNSITINGIKKFVEFLVKEKEIDIKNVKTLLDYMIEHLLDYAYFLIEEVRTEGIIMKLRFAKSLFTFYQCKYNVSSEKEQQIEKLLSNLSKLKSRINFEDGVRGKNKEIRRQTPIEDIISAIKMLDEKYEKNKNYYILKAKTSLKFLVHLVWRSSNIINMKLGETLYIKNGKWYYDIPPEQQKAPEKEGNKYKSVQGIIPKILQEDITELIKVSGTDDYLFKNQNNTKYDTPSFTNYIKKITQKHIGKILNPHIFRDIIPTYLINHNVNPIYVSSLLWHRPAMLTTVDLKYVKIDKNKAVLECNKVLMKLYKDKSELGKKANKKSNVIPFKKG